MMGGVSPETCWASYRCKIIKILIHYCILLDFSLWMKFTIPKLEILSLDLGFDVEIWILSFNSLKDFKFHKIPCVCSKSMGTGCWMVKMAIFLTYVAYATWLHYHASIAHKSPILEAWQFLFKITAILYQSSQPFGKDRWRQEDKFCWSTKSRTRKQNIVLLINIFNFINLYSKFHTFCPLTKEA